MKKGITLVEDKLGAIVSDNGSVQLMQVDLIDKNQMNRIYMSVDDVLKLAEEIKKAQQEFKEGIGES